MHHEGKVPDYLEGKYLLQDLDKIEPEGLCFSIVRELVDLLEGNITIKKVDTNTTQQIINLKVSFPLHHVQVPTKTSEIVEKYKFTDKVKVLVADEK